MDKVSKKIKMNTEINNIIISNNLDGYILHSGGMKIIEAYKKIFKNDVTIQESQRVLANYGNVSSVSVLLVLNEILKKNFKGIFLMSALGPGFTAGLCKLNISKND